MIVAVTAGEPSDLLSTDRLFCRVSKYIQRELSVQCNSNPLALQKVYATGINLFPIWLVVLEWLFYYPYQLIT